MREFGSDYHYIKDLKLRNNLDYQLPSDSRYYANGRQAIQSLIHFKKWRRIWMPEYFCYEIINSIKETGIEVEYYFDNPIINENVSISKIKFLEGDVLLRMNYFGFRKKRDNSNIAAPVIEDHSHDLIGKWAVSSNADWCIASLRKSLPIADGGILWSPKKHELPRIVEPTNESNATAALRYSAMKDKTNYLQGFHVLKDKFLNLFNKTEEGFETLPMSGISSDSYDIVSKMDIRAWYDKKKENWLVLSQISHPKVEVLQPEYSDFYPFSFVIKLNNKENRDLIRTELISKNVYPSILWNIPNTQSSKIVEFGDTCLSIHCDARYNEDDIQVLKKLIVESLSAIS